MSTFTAKLNNLYKKNLGRDVKAEGASWWKGDYDKMRAAGVSETDAFKSIEANIQRSSEYTNPTPEAAAARKHWQRGEDSTGEGNFHKLWNVDENTGAKTAGIVQTDPSKKKDFTDQVTAYFEEKGLLAGTAAMDAKVNAAFSADTTADAFRNAMKSTPTGEERGDTWGTGGRSYLLAEAQRSNVDITGLKHKELAENLINKLYTEGFGREADAEGLAHWTNALYDKKMSYAQIAGAFLGSDEARLRDVYHDEFGRDADDEGLQGWLSGGKASVNAGIAYIRSGASKESDMRELYSEHLGQHSKATDRDANYFTDVHEGGYKNLDWTGFTKDSGVTGVQQANATYDYDFGHGSSDLKNVRLTEGLGLSDGSVLTGLAHEQANMTVDDLKKLLQHKERIQNIGSTYDTDDAADGTNIGNLFTVKELEEDYKLEDYEGNENAYKALGDKLGAERWNLLTKELEKFYIEDTKPGYTGEVIIDPGTPQFNLDQRGKHRNTLHSDYDVPVPPDYADKPKATVTREETDYMSKWDGSYGKDLSKPVYREPDKPVAITRSVSPFMASQNAQGVRRKRSGAFRSGASATGTKQFQRKDSMKIQSLNL